MLHTVSELKYIYIYNHKQHEYYRYIYHTILAQHSLQTTTMIKHLME